MLLGMPYIVRKDSEMTSLTDASAATGSRSPQGSAESYKAKKRTALVTGLWYLGLAITGMLGFLIVRPEIYVSGDSASTLANLIEKATLARLGLVLEIAVVATQALAAVWFYKLFRTSNQTAAWALAAFGMANSLAIMISAAFMATALTVAGDVALAPGADAAATVQLMYELSGNFWVVGGLFFGLWLIPMGYIVVSTGVMTRWLGRILIVGGLGYVLSTFVHLGLADPPAGLVEGLVIPATIGEIWMIGYLLVRGIRPALSTEHGLASQA
jgi:hypothetical protein